MINVISSVNKLDDQTKADAFKVGTALALIVGAIALTAIGSYTGIIPITHLQLVIAGETLAVGVSIPASVWIISKIKHIYEVSMAKAKNLPLPEDSHGRSDANLFGHYGIWRDKAVSALDSRMKNSQNKNQLLIILDEKYLNHQFDTFFKTLNQLDQAKAHSILDLIVNQLNKEQCKKLFNLSEMCLKNLFKEDLAIITSFLKSISEIENIPTCNEDLSTIAESKFKKAADFDIYEQFLKDMTRSQEIVLNDKKYKYQLLQIEENYQKIVKEIFTDNEEIFKNDKDLIKILSSILNQGFFASILEKISDKFSYNGKNQSFNITKNKNNTYTITYKCDLIIQSDPDTFPKDFATCNLESVFTLSLKEGKWTSSKIISKLENIKII